MSKKNGALASKAFLLKEMVIRDVRSRYAGSSLGLLWAFAHPVLWMLLYTGVFALVLRVPVEPGDVAGDVSRFLQPFDPLHDRGTGKAHLVGDGLVARAAISAEDLENPAGGEVEAVVRQFVS